MCSHEEYDLIDEIFDSNENQELITILIYSCMICGLKGYKQYIIPNEIIWNEEESENE